MPKIDWIIYFQTIHIIKDTNLNFHSPLFNYFSHDLFKVCYHNKDHDIFFKPKNCYNFKQILLRLSILGYVLKRVLINSNHDLHAKKPSTLIHLSSYLRSIATLYNTGPWSLQLSISILIHSMQKRRVEHGLLGEIRYSNYSWAQTSFQHWPYFHIDCTFSLLLSNEIKTILKHPPCIKNRIEFPWVYGKKTDHSLESTIHFSTGNVSRMTVHLSRYLSNENEYISKFSIRWQQKRGRIKSKSSRLHQLY